MPDRVLGQLLFDAGPRVKVEIPLPLPGAVATPAAGSPVDGEWGRDWARNGPQEIDVDYHLFVRSEDEVGVPAYREETPRAPKREGVAYMPRPCDDCGQVKAHYFGELGRGKTLRCVDCYLTAAQRGV
jgi:hypothetical protein